MNRNEAIAVLDELIDLGPGDFSEPRDNAARLVQTLRSAEPALSDHGREVVRSIEERLALWFSARRWDKSDGGSRVKSGLRADIAKLATSLCYQK
jgi:hypothetical protein